MSPVQEPIRLLYVDDDPGFVDVAVVTLEHENDRFDITTATHPDDGLATLDEREFDCIVSDYDMPDRNGIEFLEAVRAEYPDLPFILFTGKGSEEVARDAFSSGASDYLQKKGVTSQFTVLANRITSAVAQYHSTVRSREREQQLEEQRQLYRSVVEQSPNGVMIVQGKTITFVNKRLEELTGLPESELLGRPFYELMTPEYRELVQRRYEQRVSGDRPPQNYQIEIQTAAKDERVVDLHVSRIQYQGEPATLATFNDVTEDKQQKHKLKRQKRQVEALHDVTRDLVRANSRQEVAERVVEAVEEILGFQLAMVRYYDEERGGLVPVAHSDYTEEVFENRPVFTPEQESLSWEAFASGEPEVYNDVGTIETAVDSNTSLSSLMIVPLGKYGTLNTGATSSGKFDESDLFLTQILATNTEVALERIEHEQELAHQNERLDEFVSIVSHDLRNPLNVGMTRLELLRDECDSDHLEAIERSHERMETLIENLLLIARGGIESFSVTTVALQTIVEECWETVETSNATLVFEGERALRADRNKLKQVFENLFRNAVEHGSTSSQAKPDAAEHGSTNPDSENREGAEQPLMVRVGTLENGFYVEDDGLGIPPDERETIFERGYSGSDVGTGLGLNIVRKVADAHGWDITVTTGDDGGARFEVENVELVE